MLAPMPPPSLGDHRRDEHAGELLLAARGEPDALGRLPAYCACQLDQDARGHLRPGQPADYGEGPEDGAVGEQLDLRPAAGRPRVPDPREQDQGRAHQERHQHDQGSYPAYQPVQHGDPPSRVDVAFARCRRFGALGGVSAVWCRDGVGGAGLVDLDCSYADEAEELRAAAVIDGDDDAAALDVDRAGPARLVQHAVGSGDGLTGVDLVAPRTHCRGGELVGAGPRGLLGCALGLDALVDELASAADESHERDECGGGDDHRPHRGGTSLVANAPVRARFDAEIRRAVLRARPRAMRSKGRGSVRRRDGIAIRLDRDPVTPRVRALCGAVTTLWEGPRVPDLVLAGVTGLSTGHRPLSDLARRLTLRHDS